MPRSDFVPTEVPATSPRAMRLLSLGALAGLVAAAVGLMAGGGDGRNLPSNAVAAVNGEILRVEEYQRAVLALASDRRDPIRDEDKRHVLDRLLDEELLVQRGLELGLVRHDRRVRADIVAAMIQAVVSQSEAREPDPGELRAFYEQNRDYFTPSGRVLARQILVRAGSQRADAEARARADEAAARLRDDEPFDSVARALGDPEVAPLPRDYLPPVTLREYLGPTAARAALELEPGSVGDPVRSALGYHVIQVLGRERGRTPPLDAIEAEVRNEWRRREGDRALRDYLDELRERADVRIAGSLP